MEARRNEQSAFHAKDIESKEKFIAETNRVETKKIPNCFSCGRACPHKGPCSAKGKECNHSGKKNHFSNVCKDKRKQNLRPERHRKGNQKAVHPLNTEESFHSSDDNYIYAVENKA